MSRDYWLVQRMYYSPLEAFTKKFPGAKINANPFGYGRLGDYELDYMGAAEFEFGALPEAAKKLSESNLMTDTHEFRGKTIKFLFTEKDGDPFEEWCKWIVTEPVSSKEPPYDVISILDGKTQASERRGQIWWSLNNNMMWSFLSDDGIDHIQQMLTSMQTVESRLRGYV